MEIKKINGIPLCDEVARSRITTLEKLINELMNGGYTPPSDDTTTS